MTVKNQIKLNSCLCDFYFYGVLRTTGSLPQSIIKSIIKLIKFRVIVINHSCRIILWITSRVHFSIKKKLRKLHYQYRDFCNFWYIYQFLIVVIDLHNCRLNIVIDSHKCRYRKQRFIDRSFWKVLEIATFL